ncbi:MAG TPA: hypothetical protein PKA03_14425 [Tabrizicola sp.]|nr:hypothetical protein [Tabrizicola sp.]
MLKLPADPEALLEEGLQPLIKRGLVDINLQPVASEAELLAFYAAPVRQLLS